MELVDARRLTGPSHLSRAPLVLVEIALGPGETADQAEALYLEELVRLREVLGFPDRPALVRRNHVGGFVLGYEAPIDVMLACAEMSEWAGQSAAERQAGRPALPLDAKEPEIRAMLASQRSPRLLALQAMAKQRGLPFLWDDDAVSLGTGKSSVTYPRDALPEVNDVPWDRLWRIPIALVTGTNGKTTTSRLLARVARESGLRVGASSTGGITVGTELLEQGDWTGPAAARIILRRDDVDLAVLETARGGILRRGLAVDACDVAVITNVSDDHLGTYGIDDVAAMAAVKGVIAKTVDETGTTVLSAHDPLLVALANELRCDVVFFAHTDGRTRGVDRPVSRVLAQQRYRGMRSVYTEDGVVMIAKGEVVRPLVRYAELPITFGGAAAYNVQNVVAVVAAAVALGIADDAIVRGLRAFGMADNPGRGQLFERDGVRVLLDFGHNPESVRAVLDLVTKLRGTSGGELTVVTASPGDRPDREIAEVARIIHAASPARVLVRELPDHLRGRAVGDVTALFRRTLDPLGLPVREVASEVDALEQLLPQAKPGDVIVVFVHIEEEGVKRVLDGWTR